MAEIASLFDEDIDNARKMDLTDLYDALKNPTISVDDKDNIMTDSKR